MPRLSRNTGVCSHASFSQAHEEMKSSSIVQCTTRRTSTSSSHLKLIKPILGENLDLTHLIQNSPLLLLLLEELHLVPIFDHCHQESQYEMLPSYVVTFCWSWNVNIARFNLIFLLSCCKWCTAWKGFWSWGWTIDAELRKMVMTTILWWWWRLWSWISEPKGSLLGWLLTGAPFRILSNSAPAIPGLEERYFQ